MQIEVNKYERVAGIFVMGALIGVLAVTFGLVIRTGYFSSKVSFYTVMESADGINIGTRVQMSGLNVGWVDEIELVGTKKVAVTFDVLEKYAPSLKEGTLVQVIRPYVLGDKTLEIKPGPDLKPILKAGVEIPSIESFDIVDLLSGRTLGPFAAKVEEVVDELNVFLEDLSESENAATLADLLKQITPMLTNVDEMAKEMATSARTMNREKRLQRMLEGMATSAEEMNKLLPHVNQSAPVIGEKLPTLISNMELLTSELRELTPILNDIGPDLPHTSRRAVEAIDEAVILMKAMQKSFMLRGNVEKVKKEEQAQ